MVRCGTFTFYHLVYYLNLWQQTTKPYGLRAIFVILLTTVPLHRPFLIFIGSFQVPEVGILTYYGLTNLSLKLWPPTPIIISSAYRTLRQAGTKSYGI